MLQSTIVGMKISCEIQLSRFRLTRSTGVVILHLLLIPGTAFITGGARIWQQNLHPHLTQLNQTLLTIGYVALWCSLLVVFILSYARVMALLLPAAFFAALDRGAEAGLQAGANGAAALISDTTRDKFLRMSRGLAVMLLLVLVSYLCYVIVSLTDFLDMYALAYFCITLQVKITPWVWHATTMLQRS